MQLSGKVAVVTGGAQGIGFHITQSFLQSGAKVAVFDIAEGDIEQLRADYNRDVEVSFYRVDVSSLAEVQQAIKDTIDRYGKIDIVVNNAGITRDGLVLRMKEQDWNDVLRINLTGAFNCTKAAAPYLLRARKGRIINIASIIGLRGNSGQANYAASKAGLIGLTKATAREFAPRGITVNAIAPGFIQTKMTEKLMETEASQSLISQIPLGRVGSPSDVAHLVAYLASDASAYITGEVIRVDGGLSM